MANPFLKPVDTGPYPAENLPKQFHDQTLRPLARLSHSVHGDIFLAQEVDGQLVVLKQFLALPPERKQHIASIAAAALHIEHANVCATFSAIDSTGSVLQEYIHGESLAALCWQTQTTSRMPLPICLHLSAQVALAVAAIHDARGDDDAPLDLSHGFLSPLCVFVGFDGTVKVSLLAGLRDAPGEHNMLGISLPPETSLAQDRDTWAIGSILDFACRSSEPVAALQPALERIVQRCHSADYQHAEHVYADIYGLLVRLQPTTTAHVAGLMKTVFRERYEEKGAIHAQVFNAPMDALTDGPLEIDTSEPNKRDVTEPNSSKEESLSCEYCGAVFLTHEQVIDHGLSCSQRRWWEQNFGGDRTKVRAGNLNDLQQQPESAVAESLWNTAHNQVPSDKQRGHVSRQRSKATAKKPGKRGLIGRFFQSRNTKSTHRSNTRQGSPSQRISVHGAAVARLHNLALREKAETLVTRLLSLFEGVQTDLPDNSPSAKLLKAKAVHLVDTCMQVIVDLATQADSLALDNIPEDADQNLNAQIDAIADRMTKTTSAAVRAQLEQSLDTKKALLRRNQHNREQSEVLHLKLDTIDDTLALHVPNIVHALQGAPRTGENVLLTLEQLVQDIRSVATDNA